MEKLLDLVKADEKKLELSAKKLQGSKSPLKTAAEKEVRTFYYQATVQSLLS